MQRGTCLALRGEKKFIEKFFELYSEMDDLKDFQKTDEYEKLSDDEEVQLAFGCCLPVEHMDTYQWHIHDWYQEEMEMGFQNKTSVEYLNKHIPQLEVVAGEFVYQFGGVPKNGYCDPSTLTYLAYSQSGKTQIVTACPLADLLYVDAEKLLYFAADGIPKYVSEMLQGVPINGSNVLKYKDQKTPSPSSKKKIQSSKGSSKEKMVAEILAHFEIYKGESAEDIDITKRFTQALKDYLNHPEALIYIVEEMYNVKDEIRDFEIFLERTFDIMWDYDEWDKELFDDHFENPYF